MANWVGVQGLVYLAKKAKTCHHCDVTPQRTPNLYGKKFSVGSRRPVESVEGLNTSAQSACGLWHYKAWTKKWSVWDVKGL